MLSVIIINSAKRVIIIYYLVCNKATKITNVAKITNQKEMQIRKENWGHEFNKIVSPKKKLKKSSTSAKFVLK